MDFVFIGVVSFSNLSIVELTKCVAEKSSDARPCVFWETAGTKEETLMDMDRRKELLKSSDCVRELSLQ